MKQGEKIKLTAYDTDYKLSSRKLKVWEGTFIKEYDTYIQFFDKYNIRRSIMKQDIVNIKRVE